jgi:hypothetical protein
MLLSVCHGRQNCSIDSPQVTQPVPIAHYAHPYANNNTHLRQLENDGVYWTIKLHLPRSVDSYIQVSCTARVKRYFLSH